MIQYISCLDFPWHKLRKETSGKSETYAYVVEGKWTKLNIEVSGDKAKLYVGAVEQPTLLINDLKLGTYKKGTTGLWVGPRIEGYFANFKVSEK